MEKRTSRRSAHYGRVNEERKTKCESDPCDTNSVIADMAQGFIQAQTTTASLNNKDIISLLEKLNNNLEKLRTPNDDKEGSTPSTSEKENPSSSEKSSHQPDQASSNDANAQGKNEIVAELKALVNTIMEEQDNENNPTSNQNKDEKITDRQAKKNKIPVQTVSQLLAKTQYELANELETSLQNLRQVISKSEKIATNISHLLGKENKNKS